MSEEYFDSPEKLTENIRKLANLMRSAKHVVLFTGAGVSTSAGIPDFRGPQGVWTLRERGIKVARPNATKIQPTKGHMAIVKLFEAGYIKYLISQNTDGLHIRSGIPVTMISELHGDGNMERCFNCERTYWRKFRVREASGVHEHATSRKCDYCKTPLQDTIVNFSESLPREALDQAYHHSRICDFHVVLGSSLLVSPANDLPQLAYKNGKPLAIVNLQKTPLDSMATIRLFGKTDEVLLGLCLELGLGDVTEIRDIEMDSSFTGMIIAPGATRKIDVIRESYEELREWPISKLLNALRERGVKERPLEKEELIKVVMDRCKQVIYWV